MMPRRAGERRSRVEVQEKDPTYNAAGDEIPNWKTVAYRWARVSPLSGREYLQAQQVQATTTHEVEMDYVSFLTVRHRLKVRQGRLLDINRIVDVDERRHTHVLSCTEAVGQSEAS